jgi:formylglycine-generating enzyme required for sulfatase activity
MEKCPGKWRRRPSGGNGQLVRRQCVLRMALGDGTTRERVPLTYRLPTNEEWNAAVGAARFPWGDIWPPPSSGLGNYWDETAATTFGPDIINIKPIPGYEDGFATTSPVKSFPPNRFGLYDLGSNVQEWCREKSDNGKVRRRGASWKDSTEDAVSSLNQQLFSPPEQRSVFIGFRCVLERPTEAANNRTK